MGFLFRRKPDGCDQAAVDCGINFIDTAPAYNGGRAEQYIGEVVHNLASGKK